MFMVAVLERVLVLLIMGAGSDLVMMVVVMLTVFDSGGGDVSRDNHWCAYKLM